MDKEIFSDLTSGERHEVDLIAKAKFRGEDAFFLIHVEHQSYSEADFGRRLFRYFAKLYDLYNLPIYPIVIFSFDLPKRAEPSSHQIKFPDHKVLEFNYRVIQLNRLNWRDYVNSANPVASALMAKMNIVPEDRAKVKVECLRLLITLKLTPAKTRFISGFIDTYLELNAVENLIMRQQLETINPQQKELAMEIVTSWMREGIAQGLEQGLKQGLKEGVLNILTIRFENLSPQLIEQINSIDELSQLRDLHQKAVKSATLNEFESYLTGKG